MSNVLEGAVHEGKSVKCRLDNGEINAIIVKLSDYTSVLNEALDDYEPPSGELDSNSTLLPEVRQPVRQGTSKTTKQPPQKQAKRPAQSIDSGEAQRCHDLPADIPDYSIYEIEEAAIQDSSENKRTSETQTDQKKTINNSTQTKMVGEYDQEIPQSPTTDNPMAPRGRAAQPSRDTRKTN